MRRVFLPHTLMELWSCLEQEPDAVLYSGGTDFLVKMRVGPIDPPALICMERISELRGVREESADLWLGACTTHAELINDPLIQMHLPVLMDSLKTLGSPLIRNMGTIGGNICTASPAGDTLPPLYVLQAEVELRSANNTRLMPIDTFIIGPGETQLKRGEILAGIRVRKPEGFNLHHFEKVGQRKAMAIAIASMASLIKMSSRGVIESARLAWGSVAPKIVTSPEVEKFLTGRTPSQKTLEKAARLVREAVSPIDDVRATADYRRIVSGNLLLRLTHYAKK
jgi:CO/xanthine dehydrogenase FAD-binding subunit